MRHQKSTTTDDLTKRLTDTPVENEFQIIKIFEPCNEDFIINAPTCVPIPKTINKGCDKIKTGTLKAYKYKPSIVNNGQKYEKKKEKEGELVKKVDKPNKLLKSQKEKVILQNNAKNVTININHIQSPKKVLKKGFPSIFSRRKSVRNIIKELEKPAIIVLQETMKIKKKIIMPMLTRSKTIPEGPKKGVPLIVTEWMTTPKPNKVAPKCPKATVKSEM